MDELTTLRFVVNGTPRQKNRHRRVFNKQTGRVFEHPDQNTVKWENLIRHEFQVAYPDWIPTERPVTMNVLAFWMPQSNWPKYKLARLDIFDELVDRTDLAALPSKDLKALLADPAMTRPLAPDDDNIKKAVADALNGIVYRDDRQIVASLTLKAYSRQPRLVVCISLLPKAIPAKTPPVRSTQEQLI